MVTTTFAILIIVPVIATLGLVTTAGPEAEVQQ